MSKLLGEGQLKQGTHIPTLAFLNVSSIFFRLVVFSSLEYAWTAESLIEDPSRDDANDLSKNSISLINRDVDSADLVNTRALLT